jgi:hypothetical protein
MSVMLPGQLVFVLNLIGFNWPAADEDKLKESARHWREYATELDAVLAESSRILDQIRSDNSGESIDALELHWRQVGEHLGQAHAASGTVAEVLDGFALVVEGLKGAVVVQLGILAAELAATTAAAFLTFGAAELAAPEEILVTQGIMRWLSREAIQKAEQLVAQKIAKAVTEHFLSIKNGLKALKASRTTLTTFGKGVVKSGVKDLERGGGPLKPGGALPGGRQAIHYGPLDSLQRPTGIEAQLTHEHIGTGTPASRAITPPGFQGGAAGHARGHLLGNQLGGSGHDPKNLVTIFQNPANSPAMRSMEFQVRGALEAGQTVHYTSTPIYVGSEVVARGITLRAIGSGDLSFWVTILNRGL